MSKLITILVKERPPYDPTLITGGYCRKTPEKSFRLIEDGYAVGYDPDTGEETYPFLPEEYPNRNVLFDAGIYTEEDLSSHLTYVSNLKGIGSKTMDTYTQLLHKPSDTQADEELPENE